MVEVKVHFDFFQFLKQKNSWRFILKNFSLSAFRFCLDCLSVVKIHFSLIKLWNDSLSRLYIGHFIGLFWSIKWHLSYHESNHKIKYYFRSPHVRDWNRLKWHFDHDQYTKNVSTVSLGRTRPVPKTGDSGLRSSFYEKTGFCKPHPFIKIML